MGEVTGEELSAGGAPLQEALRSGVALCLLANAVSPGAVPRINKVCPQIPPPPPYCCPYPCPYCTLTPFARARCRSRSARTSRPSATPSAGLPCAPRCRPATAPPAALRRGAARTERAARAG
jgi:hypothetical protein